MLIPAAVDSRRRQPRTAERNSRRLDVGGRGGYYCIPAEASSQCRSSWNGPWRTTIVHAAVSGFRRAAATHQRPPLKLR